MKQRFYIDSHAGIGRTYHREDRIPFTADALQKDMAYYRIHAALLYSNTAKHYSFTKGNSQVLDIIKSNDRLYGAATVIPGIQYEIDQGFSYYDQLIAHGMKAFKIYPKSMSFSFDPFTMEEFVNYTIRLDVPLMIDIGETSWPSLAIMLDAFKDLKLVLCQADWGDNRNLLTFMNRFSKLYCEISSNQAHNVLDTFKKHVGIDRILFGTDYPNKVMGGLKALVEYSYLSESEKDMVAYLNAARLFKIDPDSMGRYPESDCQLDELALKMDQGMPLDNIDVIDSHAHIVDHKHAAVSSTPMYSSDEDSIVAKMNKLGINKTVVSSWEGILTGGDSANDTVLHACEKYKGRIEAYATFNPNYMDDLSNVINIYHEKNRFIGIKPYPPRHGYNLLDARYDKWFEYGNAKKLIALIHSDNADTPEKVEILSEKYKDLVFILAHAGMSYEMARHDIAVVKKRDNVYLEITYTSLTNGIIEYMVNEVGSRKILFGTDMPMRDPAPQMAWVCYARIPIEDKQNILGKNALRLINQCYSVD